jgi:RNA-directed DNA polymerase
MIKASNDLQDLRRRLYVKAKSETSWRFWGLYVHVCKMETLRKAYALSRTSFPAHSASGPVVRLIRHYSLCILPSWAKDYGG